MKAIMSVRFGGGARVARVFLLTALTASLPAVPARAEPAKSQGKAEARPQQPARDSAAPTAAEGKRVVSVSEVTITGRVQKPVAAVDVSRIPQKLTLHELEQRFLPRIKRALYRAPF